MEHYAGRWPFWLSPRQAVVVPVAMTDEIVAYARATRDGIAGVSWEGDRPLPMGRRTFRVDIDESSNSLGKKVRAARAKRYNYIIVIGEENVRAGTVSVDALGGDGQSGSSGDGDGGGVEWAKREMMAGEVYEHFRALEDRYA